MQRVDSRFAAFAIMDASVRAAAEYRPEIQKNRQGGPGRAIGQKEQVLWESGPPSQKKDSQPEVHNSES
jgi:hypothetical protein